MLNLSGPDGVGVSELKKRLLISDPDRYGVTVPRKTQSNSQLLRTHTHLLKAATFPLSDTTREKSRQETEGVDYHFLSVHMFEEEILNDRYSTRRRSSHLGLVPPS